MKNKSLKLTLLLSLSLLFVVSIALLAACNNDLDPSGFVAGQGNTIKVELDSTLDPLVAGSVDKMSYGYIDYRLKPGSPVPEPGTTKDTSKPVLEGYVFDGYYQCHKAMDGTVVWISDQKWDFSTKVTEDMFTGDEQVLTLYGKWFIQYKIRINYVMDVDGQAQVQQGQSTEIKVDNNRETVNAIAEPKWSDHTFLQMYRDPECKQELTVSASQPFAHGCTQSEPVCDVYAKFIDGNWTLVRTANDLRVINVTSRLYLMNNIDMSQYENVDEQGHAKITVPDSFRGEINGNGYTISNLHFFREGKESLPINYASYCIGLFAQLNGATIRNITFEDCTVGGRIHRQNTDKEYYYGFIAGQALGTCTFDNISFVNCEKEELQFNTLNLSAEQIEDIKANLDSNFFIGAGSTYHPDIVNTVESQINTLVRLVKTQALKRQTTIFC